MSNHCFTPILGKRIRVTTLDDCGNFPLPGAPDAFIATDGFVTVTIGTETEDGAEIIQKKADGSLHVNEKLANSFKYLTVEIEFSGVNPALFSMMTNAVPYMSGVAGDTIGFTVREGPITKKFALELWTGLSGVACLPGQDSASGYLLLPFVNGGTFDDLAVDGENAASFKVTGAYTKGGNGWGVGPYEVVADAGIPGPLPTALDPFDHMLLIDTSLALPPSACDPQPMPTVAVAAQQPASKAKAPAAA